MGRALPPLHCRPCLQLLGPWPFQLASPPSHALLRPPTPSHALLQLAPGLAVTPDGLPAVRRLHNLYHPYDPVAHRCWQAYQSLL